MKLLAENHPQWEEYKKSLISGKISYYQAEKEMGINRANLHYAVNRVVLVPACKEHGVNCSHRCRPKSTKIRKPGWLVKTPSCKCGELLSFKTPTYADNLDRSITMYCDECGKQFEIDTQIRYKITHT